MEISPITKLVIDAVRLLFFIIIIPVEVCYYSNNYRILSINLNKCFNNMNNVYTSAVVLLVLSAHKIFKIGDADL